MGHDQDKNANGNGHVTRGLRKAPAAPILEAKRPEQAIGRSPIEGDGVSFKTSDGSGLSGSISRMQRHAVFFELYNPPALPRLSESLANFKIVLQGREMYAGRAVVHNIVDAGTKIVCEATLDELCWQDFNLLPALQWHEQVAGEFKRFLADWRKSYRVLPEFKVVVADMQTFLQKLQVWLEQVQMKARDSVNPSFRTLEIEAAAELAPRVIQALDVFIGEFESIVENLGEDAHPDWRSYFRRQLHPLLLTSPFARRAFDKPLGYAGDYGTIELMFGTPYAGDTLFAKIINAWLLGQLLVQAHINRVARLEQKIVEETVRAGTKGRPARILNIGCGPAVEVRRFVEKPHISEMADFVLVDFNPETLEYLRHKLGETSRHADEAASYRCVKKSVVEIIKDNGKSLAASAGRGYDYIYCAGLFDYLADNVCKHLMNIFYDMLAPEGLLLATNTALGLSGAKPFLFSMDYILDWNLIYRSPQEFAEVAPDLADRDHLQIVAENTGTNLFLEVRKPQDVR